MRVLGGPAAAALVVALAVTGCSSGEPAGVVRSTPSPSTSPGPGTGVEQPEELSRCRVAGFVPSTRTVVVSRRREVLYGSALDLDPGTGVGGLELQLLGHVRPGAVVDAPRGAELDPDVVLDTERAAPGTSVAALPAERKVRRMVHNRTDRPLVQALYLDARVVRSRWTARVCGGLTNDGTSVTVLRGHTTTTGPVAFHAVPCPLARRSRIPQLREICAAG